MRFYETGRHLLRYSAAEDAKEDTNVAEDEELGGCSPPSCRTRKL